MLRLGILGCDTSHVVEFTKRLMHTAVAESLWVDGGQVVAAWPGTSRIAPDRIQGYVQQLQSMGVALVHSPDELRGMVDAVLIESQEGATHRPLATPFLLDGIPTFVDKPFACSIADAQAMVDAAAKGSAPLLSASSLRFAREVQALSVGAISGAFTYTPGTQHPLNPGLFHYGVHGVEQLYALMGPGCRSVRSVRTEGADEVSGLWKDGRIGTVRAVRHGAGGFGFTAFGDKGTVSTTIDMTWPYTELLRVILAVLSGAPSPVSSAELVEAVAFQVAAFHSASLNGQPIAIDSE